MIALGTRPETIKMAPVIRALQKYEQPFSLVHSGQHYDYNLSIRFIEELNLPRPDHNLRFRESLPAAQTGRMMMGLEKIVKRERPKLMLIQGDTNTMLASALTAFKQNVPVGHVEAGSEAMIGACLRNTTGAWSTMLQSTFLFPRWGQKKT